MEKPNKEILLRTGWIQPSENHVAPDPVENPYVSLFPHQREVFDHMYRLETEGVTVSPTTSFRTQVGILCDKRGTGKRTTLLSYLETFPKSRRSSPLSQLNPMFGVGYWETTDTEPTNGGNLVVVPHSLIVQWARASGSFPRMKTLVLPNLARWKGTASHVAMFDTVIISCNILMQFYNRYKDIRWSRVVFDEADSIDAVSCPHVKSTMYWFISAHLYNLLHPLQWSTTHLLLPVTGMMCNGFLRNTFQRLAYYTNDHEEIVRLFLRVHDEFLMNTYPRPDIRYNLVPTPIHPTERTLEEILAHTETRTRVDFLYACGIRPRDLQETVEEAKVVWNFDSTNPIRFGGDANALVKHLHPKSKECVVCMEKTRSSICFTCCFNFVCLECLKRILSTESNQIQTTYPWMVRCPCCRSSCPLQWMSYIDKTEVVPEWPIFQPKVDHVLQTIDTEERTILLNRDWNQLEVWTHAFETWSIDYRIVQGTYARIQKMIDDFNHERGCKLLILRGLYHGFHIDADHIVCTDVSMESLQELIDMCRSPTRTKPITVSLFEAETSQDAIEA